MLHSLLLYGKKRKGTGKPWFTPELKNLSSLLREMARVNSNIDSEDYSVRYHQLKRFYKEQVNKARSAYNDERILESKNINKTCWNIVNEHRIVETRSQAAIVQDGKELDAKNIPDAFNDFFVDGTRQAAIPLYTPGLSDNVSNSIYIAPVSEYEIQTAITRCCKKQSSGVDEIPGSILQEVGEIISHPLQLIINESFNSGIYPVNLKTSKIIPVFKKKGSDDNVSNYRPIAVQCQLSKVFEYCFHTRLYNFLEKFNILSPSQHGYQKSKSTITALNNIISTAYDALNQKMKSIALFFDMSKAFDSVDHGLLLRKLYNMGIRGQANKWISSYLTNREQVVFVNGFQSRKRSVDRGIPQGTILGPLLFCVLINDLPSSCYAASNVNIYADDTSITVVDSDLEQLIWNTETVIRQLQLWCGNNGITLNDTKTHMLQYVPTNDQVDKSVLVRMSGKSVHQVESVKVLGLNIDCKLTWRPHIQKIRVRLSSVVYMFRSLRTTVSRTVLVRMYYGLFQSVIDYGLVFWGSSSHVESVFKIQKKVIRVMDGVSPKTHCAPLFLKYQIMTIYSRYIYNLVINVKKTAIYRNSDIHSYNTRAKDLLRPEFQRLTTCQSRTEFIGVGCYNKLPASIRDHVDFGCFKKACRDLFTSKPYYSINEYLDS